ncbi:hypothetical protein AUK22_08225, partial [bacterium CG2_30_54_10]
MQKMIHQVEKYVREILGIPVTLLPWENSAGLPQYLRERYRFSSMMVLGTDFILMVDTAGEEQSPAVTGKHAEMVQSRGRLGVIYVRNAVTSYNRKRLIERKVPFIVPGNQMYIPTLGIDLREHFKALRERKLVFSPSTHALLLYVLLRKEADTLTPAETAHRLGYSPMSMTRAFDELERADIGEHTAVGKERHLHFPEKGRHLWEMVLPYLTTPVRKRLYVSEAGKINGNLAGQSALARYTMLSEPKNKVFAFSAEDWKVGPKSGEIKE